MSDQRPVLRDVVDLPVAGFWGEDIPRLLSNIPCRVVRNGDVAKDGRIKTSELPIRYFSHEEIEKSELKETDIVLVSSGAYTGNCGRIEIDTEDARVIASNFVRRLRPRGVNSDWLFQLCRSDFILSQVAAHTGGSAIPNLQSSLYRGCVIPRPPSLNRQEHIASILNSIDGQIQKTEAMVWKYQQIKIGLIHDLLMDSGGSHKEMLFGDCLLSGPQNGLYKPSVDYGPEGIPIVRIDGFYDGRLSDVSLMRTINVNAFEEFHYGLVAGDILINRVNSIDYIGKSALVPPLTGPLVYESNIMRCRVREELVLPNYAIRWLCSSVAKNHFRLRAKSAIAQASINQTDVRSLPIRVPSLAQQRRMCDLFLSADNQIDSNLLQLEKLGALRIGLINTLIIGAGA